MLICIYSFYPVLHVAARFFLKIVKMWASPLVHDAILICNKNTILQQMGYMIDRVLHYTGWKHHDSCERLSISPLYPKNETYLNFHPLKVVGRGSETQLQVDENLNKIT